MRREKFWLGRVFNDVHGKYCSMKLGGLIVLSLSFRVAHATGFRSAHRWWTFFLGAVCSKEDYLRLAVRLQNTLRNVGASQLVGTTGACLLLLGLPTVLGFDPSGLMSGR